MENNPMSHLLRSGPPSDLSPKQKVNLVLRIVCGEPIEIVARESHIPPSNLKVWTDTFLEKGRYGLSPKEEAQEGLEVVHSQVEDLIKALQDIQLRVSKVSQRLDVIEEPIVEADVERSGQPSSLRSPDPLTLPTPMPEETLKQLETVLVVDDDEGIQTMVKRILEMEGYTVLIARFNSEALLLAHRHSGVINLMIADVMMPGISGPEFGSKLGRSRPDMKILYMSGWPQETVFEKLAAREGVSFIQKPFEPEALLQTVREVLDAPLPMPV